MLKAYILKLYKKKILKLFIFNRKNNFIDYVSHVFKAYDLSYISKEDTLDFDHYVSRK